MSAPDATTRRSERAWQVLAGVADPEIPALSIRDLGIVRGVHEGADGTLVVTLTPTYSGCPAIDAILHDARQALLAAGLGPLRVELQRAPAWSTDSISEAGCARLREYGIAAPPRVARGAASPSCPRCGSTRTSELSAFGSTPCKALWRCRACAEPFEWFKPL